MLRCWFGSNKDDKKKDDTTREFVATVAQKSVTLEAKVEEIQQEVKKNSSKLKRASMWRCEKLALKTKHVDEEIERQQRHHDTSEFRPCGEWIPCFGLFEPKRTNARKRIAELKQKKSNLEDSYQSCIRTCSES